MNEHIYIGTQGWNYDAWVGPFYPINTRPADFLSVYSRAFNTVEVDSTFTEFPQTQRSKAGPIARRLDSFFRSRCRRR